jgi:hypothetical protein
VVGGENLIEIINNHFPGLQSTVESKLGETIRKLRLDEIIAGVEKGDLSGMPEKQRESIESLWNLCTQKLDHVQATYPKIYDALVCEESLDAEYFRLRVMWRVLYENSEIRQSLLDICGESVSEELEKMDKQGKKVSEAFNKSGGAINGIVEENWNLFYDEAAGIRITRTAQPFLNALYAGRIKTDNTLKSRIIHIFVMGKNGSNLDHQ